MFSISNSLSQSRLDSGGITGEFVALTLAEPYLDRGRNIMRDNFKIACLKNNYGWDHPVKPIE